MKVEKIVGWLTGANGTGNIFEISHNGGFALAMIWQDSKFHYISKDDVLKHISEGKASLSSTNSFLAESALLKNADGALTVENPDGWARLYVASDNTAPVVPIVEISDDLVFPVSVKFEGSVKINIAGLSKIFKILSE